MTISQTCRISSFNERCKSHTWTRCLSLDKASRIQIGGKEPTKAVKTALGWTVSGALPKKETSHLSVSCNLSVASDPLSEQMKKWWDMETYSSVCNVTGKSKEEKRALSILEKTTKHNG